jgi:hypothetical protein
MQRPQWLAGGRSVGVAVPAPSGRASDRASSRSGEAEAAWGDRRRRSRAEQGSGQAVRWRRLWQWGLGKWGRLRQPMQDRKMSLRIFY